MHFPWIAWESSFRQDQRLAEAEQRRRGSRLRATGSRQREHPLAGIGRHLVFAGLRLRARYETEICAAPRAHRAGC